MIVYCVFPVDGVPTQSVFLGTKKAALDYARELQRMGHSTSVTLTEIPSPITKEMALNLLNHQGFARKQVDIAEFEAWAMCQECSGAYDQYFVDPRATRCPHCGAQRL